MANYGSKWTANLIRKIHYQFPMCFTQSAILSQYVQKSQEWINFWHTKSACPMCVELDNGTEYTYQHFYGCRILYFYTIFYNGQRKLLRYMQVCDMNKKTYPNVELDILILYCFNVEANGRYSCNWLAQFQFVQNSCWTLRVNCCVK